ncbi:MAG: peptidoglycan binding domain-containing protein, partial [Clostridium sp.]|nr:peptidoglycan binding domain-containing protein [Clostridium sp.]
MPQQSFTRIIRASLCIVILLLLIPATHVYASFEPTVQNGVFAEHINLAGMTEIEATAAIEEFVSSLEDQNIVLVVGGEQEILVTAKDLGISWKNPDLITEALTLGTGGNIIERYKALKDLEYENKIFDIELTFQVAAINTIISEKCTPYDQKAVNYNLIREDDEFIIIPGQVGYKIDIESSIDVIYQYLTTQWDRST